MNIETDYKFFLNRYIWPRATEVRTKQVQTQIYVLLHPANCVCEFFSENKLNQSIMNLKLNEGDIHKYSHVPSINNMWTKYGEPILLCHRVSNLLK